MRYLEHGYLVCLVISLHCKLIVYRYRNTMLNWYVCDLEDHRTRPTKKIAF
jgi:hypothetical protein